MRNLDDIRIAVEGRASGCRVVVCDRLGMVVGQSTGGPADVEKNLAMALSNICAAFEAVRGAVGATPEQFRAAPAWLGLAGATDPGLCERAATALPLDIVTVSDDRVPALVGALAGNDGCIAVAGTQSYAARQSRGARSFSSDGEVPSPGGASEIWLGKSILSQSLAADEGSVPSSPLIDEITAEFNGPSGIEEFCDEAQPEDFSRFAPRVVEAAEGGDLGSQALLQSGADWIQTELRALGWKPREPLCLTGSLGPKLGPYLPKEMQEAWVAPRGGPMDGVIRLANSLRR